VEVSLRFAHGGQSFRLRFEHGVGDSGAAYTTAALDFRPSLDAPWAETWAAHARCSPSDAFVKEVGRQIALDRLAARVREYYPGVAGAALRAYYTREGARGRVVPQSARAPKWNGVETP
jgi:hypothetical protein